MNMATMSGVVSGVLTAALLAAPEARACGVGGWCGDYAAPRAGVIIPLNAPALVHFAATNPTWRTVTPRAELLGPDGLRLAADIRPDGNSAVDRLLVPRAPLEPGPHTLVHAACEDRETRDSFTVGPAVPLPTRIGSVRLEPLPVETMTARWVSGCGWTAQVSSVRIVVVPSPELTAYLSLARFTLMVDGVLWQTSAYGSDRASDPDHPDAISVLRPFTFCDPRWGAEADQGAAGGGSSASGSIPPGKHRAQLSVHVAGATEDPPPLEFDLVTTCGDVPDGRPVPGAGDAGGSEMGGPDRGAGAGRAGGGGGCAIAGVSASGWAGSLVLAALGAIARRSRHRRC